MWNKFENMPKRKELKKRKRKIEADTYKILKAKPIFNIHDGDIYFVSNKTCNIPMYRGFNHPGIVLKHKSSRKIIVSIGTDINNITPKWMKAYTILTPNLQNGLKKNTAFFKTPKEINKIAIKYDKYIGYICEKDLNIIVNNCGL